MRLLNRLVLSHTVPVLVMLVALGVLLGSLARITAALGEVRDVELGSVHQEEALHRAGWAVEVAMRHGAVACEEGRPSAEVAASIEQRVSAIDTMLGRESRLDQSALTQIIRGYAKLGSRVSAAGTCETLLADATRKERERLDEELTDAWISRMFELHRAVADKDEKARGTATSTFWGGLALSLVALAAAALLAQRIARTVTQPLDALATQARRIGEGDFAAKSEVSGPAEVQEFARELEVMRSRLAELDNLKQGFLASVSHELRTPLTKIREALSLLADGAGGGISERQARIVHIAQVACEREIRTVTTLLDLSRLRAGTPLKLRAGANIDLIIEDALDEEREEATSREITVSLVSEGEAPEACLDGALVERAVANIVRNAVSVSKPGDEVLVRRELLDTGPDGQRGAFASISVTDRGPGVPPEIRQTIFETFVTQAVANSPKKVGVGLGLALSREIARAHGGELELAEGEGAGATFRLWIPLDRDAPPAPTAATLGYALAPSAPAS